MLSYRHAFHAGNHADVLKHLVQVQVLAYLAQKDKPFWCVDTHAGAAQYNLGSTYAQKNAEYDSGIARLWERDDLPPAVAAYVDQVRACNPDGHLQHYPGSPQISLQLLRPQDRLRLFELHSTDAALLRQHCQAAGRQVQVEQSDGFAGLLALLPPPPRRGLMLIDPSYEDKADYRRVLTTLEQGLKRFATGTFLVWYPQLQRHEAARFPEQLMQLVPDNWLHVSLGVHPPSPDGFGMHGSGLFLLNPPWTLPDTLQSIMPWLVEVLGDGPGAGFSLQHTVR